MTTLDRYILRNFLVNLIILFAVMVLLIVMLDLITNFDEFVQAAQRVHGGSLTRAWAIIRIAVDFYGPMVFLLYVYMIGLLPVGAAGFTLASLIRNRELVAIMAGGISLRRVAMPILVMGFIANVGMVADQEFALPAMAAKLGRARSDIKLGELRHYSIQLMRDGSGALFTCAAFDFEHKSMKNVTILVRQKLDDGRYGRASQRITATQAVWDDNRHGWQLIDGYAIERELADRPRTSLTAHPHHEIDFYATDLSPLSIILNVKSSFRNLLSMSQLTQLIHSSGAVNIAELRLIRQSRVSLLVINMLILMMGVSYFLLRAPANLLKQSIKCAIVCVGAWASGFIMLQISPGSLPPALIAWLPVVIYTPMAVYLLDVVET